MNLILNKSNMKSLESLQPINLKSDYAENGELVVIESGVEISFDIKRVFFVRADENSIRGNHSHKKCSQFLCCVFGAVEVECDNGLEKKSFILNKPNIGLLIPPGIWAKQKYLKPNNVLIVACNRIYESDDYIRDYNLFLKKQI